MDRVNEILQIYINQEQQQNRESDQVNHVLKLGWNTTANQYLWEDQGYASAIQGRDWEKIE